MVGDPIKIVVDSTRMGGEGTVPLNLAADTITYMFRPAPGALR